MHAFLIVSTDRAAQEKETQKLLAKHRIDSIDITRLASDTSLGIDTVRELVQKTVLKPFKSREKAIIIEDAQTLTIEAQNAFLKTLEEPPENTIIILLVSTNVDALLPTVVSRCQIIEIRNTKYEIRNEELSALSSQLSDLLKGGIGERFVLAEEVGKDKNTATDWLEKMILTARQLLIAEISTPAEGEARLWRQYLNILRLLQRAHTLLSTTNVNPRFTLETLFLSISATM